MKKIIDLLLDSEKVQLYLIIVLLLIIGLGYKCTTEKNNKIEELHNLNKVISDTLKITYNKLGQQEAVISSYSSDIKTFLNFNSNGDSLTIQLQNELKNIKKELKNVSAAVSFASTTKIEDVSNTYITYSLDSFPIYKSTLSDKWYDANIIATKDSTSLSLLLRNDYNAVFAFEKRGKGLFKDKIPIVKITNLNPYSETTDARSFSFPEVKQKRLGIGLNTTLGYDILSRQPALVIGAGLQYNLIYIK